jgi:predicted nuclease of predicted toxin-antitoxin system
MMKVLVDMNLSPGWVNFLIEAEFEAVHWSDVGESSAPDAELMQWAAARGYVVLTAHLGFGAILATTESKRPSVVQIRNDILTPRAIGGQVAAAIRQTLDELLDGALVSVDPTRARIRILPLTR